jgi:hypothetical protein
MDTTVTVPGGLWLEGVRHHQVGLRPFTGADEAFLLEMGDDWFPAQKVTAVLARNLTHVSGHDPAGFGQNPTAIARALTIGDREALLLHLRRLTLGDRLQCIMQCPDCGEKMDLDLRVGDLLLPPYDEPRPHYSADIDANGTAKTISFRLPTGGDQEAIADTAVRDASQAAYDLLWRCVIDADEDESSILTDSRLKAVSALMAERDPQAEIMLNLDCPACGQSFTAMFDTATYFFREVADRTTHLYREVHLLAFYYHWSESEIMNMTAEKRHRYLDLLAEELDRP